MPENLNKAQGELEVVYNDAPAVQGMNRTIDASNKMGEALDKSSDKGEKALDDLAKAAEARANRIAESEKRATQVILQESRERSKELQKEIEQERTRTAKARRPTPASIRAKSEGTVAAIQARSNKDVRVIEAQRENNRLQALYRLDQTAFEEAQKRNTAVFKDQLRERRTTFQRELKQLGPMSQQWQNAMNASIGRNNAAYILGMQSQATGLTPTQLWQQQMNAATRRANAANAAALIPPAFGAPPGGGRGGRGGGGNLFTRLLGGGGGGLAGSIASGLLGGFGVGLGGYALANIAQGVGADVDRATAYERQSVAARNLAGSQAKLNELLAAYAVASGDAIDKTTSLENVTRLMATGFANSAPEVEKFVRATRGASIALGRPQDYVIQETQLAISNVSVKRLDQIGLGITEVNQRIEELRATNTNWTREMAFQEAVISLLDEKYGSLTETAEGQATGVEKLRKAWSDLRLEMGLAAKGPVEGAAGWLGSILDAMANAAEKGRETTRQGARRSAQLDLMYMQKQNEFGFSSSDMIGRMTGRTGTQVLAQHALNNNLLPNTPSSGYIGGPEDVRLSGPVARFKDEQRNVLSSFYDRGLEMERNYQQQRTAQIEQYESQRLSIIQNFGKMMVREEQDFALQRRRGLEDYERSVVGVMRDAQEREEGMREDLAEKIAEAREGHEKRIRDIQEKYEKDREKAHKDHLDRLMKAAGQLDAIAVLEERKRWKRENEEREEGYQDALEQERENLQEQIDEAQKAHDKRLEDAREADRKRLQEMAEQRRIQLEREDEDRAIRLERAKEDHDAQLAELDRLHVESLSKMATQYAEDRKLFEEEFARAMHDAGVYIEGMAEKVLAKQKLEEQFFDKMIGKYEKLLGIQEDPNRYSYDPKTGPNIPLDYGQRLSTSSMVQTSSGAITSNSRSVSLAQGAIQIFPAPEHSAYDIGKAVEAEVVKLLETY